MGQLALIIAGTVLTLPPGRAFPLRLERGHEFIYNAQYIREGDHSGARFTQFFRTYTLILEVTPNSAKAAFMTVQHVQTKPGVDPVPVVRLDTGRIDALGRVTLDTPSTLPRVPIDLPPTLETYPFLELPPESLPAGGTWTTADPEMGPASWKAGKLEQLETGHGECVMLLGEQSSRNGNRAGTAVWNRNETVHLLMQDGLVDRVQRDISWRTESGDTYKSTCVISLEAIPAPKGSAELKDRALEIHAAQQFARDLAELMQPQGESNPRAYDDLLRRIDRYDDRGTPYYQAIKSIRRRAELAKQGIRPPEPIIIRVEKQAPVELIPVVDTTLRDLESGKALSLSSLRGRPIVLVFFKPTADPNELVLRYIRAAGPHYARRVEVIALMVDGTVADAKFAQLRVPVYDGRGVLGGTGPRVMVLDGAGTVRLNLPGWTSDSSKSVNDELNRILQAKPN